MSRQLDAKQEERTARRHDALIRALDFELAGVLGNNGVELLGLALKWDAWDCLMTLKGESDGQRQVCFVGSDSPINCIVKAVNDAKRGTLRWKEDTWIEHRG